MKLNNVTVPLLMALLLSQKALVGDNRLKKLSVVGYNPPGCMGEQQALLATSPTDVVQTPRLDVAHEV